MKINVRCPYCNSDHVGIWRSFGITCHHDDAFTVPKGHYLICLDCRNGFRLMYHEGKKASEDQVNTLKEVEEIEKHLSVSEEESDGN